MNIKVDKRVPFGFKGKWAKCYKLNTLNESDWGFDHAITYQKSYYYDVGYYIQLKDLENGVNKFRNNTQPIENLVTDGVVRYFKTTDAYFNGSKYDCVVQLNDILCVDNEYFIVEKVDDKSIYTPEKQTFYYLTTKQVYVDVVKGDSQC